jgi:hypothetical protein
MDDKMYMDYVRQFSDFSYDQFGTELDKALAVIIVEINSLTEP